MASSIERAGETRALETGTGGVGIRRDDGGGEGLPGEIDVGGQDEVLAVVAGGCRQGEEVGLGGDLVGIGHSAGTAAVGAGGIVRPADETQKDKAEGKACRESHFPLPRLLSPPNVGLRLGTGSSQHAVARYIHRKNIAIAAPNARTAGGGGDSADGVEDADVVDGEDVGEGGVLDFGALGHAAGGTA
ncbi:MAG: hypothetical protein RBU25_07015, partial [Lentisphaeria bacterium]|nr:hypothetical protein [Lentisphaeria bacterium]